MKICCSSPMVPGETLTQKAEKLRDWGYDAIAVFWQLADWNDEVHSELLALEDRTGVKPVEFVLFDDVYGKGMSDDPQLRSQCREMYKLATRVCAEIGAVTEMEYEYGPQIPLPLFDPFQQLNAEQHAGFIDFYREILQAAEGSDAKVLLEPLNRYESRYLNLSRDNITMIDEVDHPNAGLLPDTFHLSLEEGDLAEAIRSAGGRVKHVHLGDSNRLLPGHGHLDWDGIFGALRDIGFSGYVNLECSNEGDPERTLPATATHLRQLIKG